MEKFLFRSKCPSCLEEGDIISWTHSGCGGYIFIDENVDLTCQKCNIKFFVLNARFNCAYHSIDHCGYRDNNNNNFIISMISIISDIQNFPGMNPSTRIRMMYKLKNYLN